MNRVIDVDIQCSACHKTAQYDTKPVPGYQGAVLKSFWCKCCGEAQVIRFKFIGDEVEVVERLEASAIYVSEKPELGITIRPRLSTPGS